jgi:hypothetical protein
MTLEEASAFVERVGIALVFPVVDLVLPSPWEEALGSREVVVFVVDVRGIVISIDEAVGAGRAVFGDVLTAT